MFYWLFTVGKTVLSPLLCSLACGAFTLPLLALWLQGVGIRRSADAGKRSRPRNAIMVICFGAVNAASIAIYTNVLATMALQRPTSRQQMLKGALAVLVGGDASINQYRLLILGIGLGIVLMFVNMALWQGMRRGGWLYEEVDRWRRPNNLRGEMGSAHFCTMREYRRYRREDSEGITLLGAFWGARGRRLDWGYGKFCLSSEDAARGVLVLGAPGSGKTQAVVLPVIADRMWQGHSLIVVDPQGELTPHIDDFADVTGHHVIVHDPTSTNGQRFNLAEGLISISAANAIARVLVPSVEGENKFWSDSAVDLLTACLLRFTNLGEIKTVLSDMRKLAEQLAEIHDDAALAAGSFIASVQADGKIATNIIATLGTALTGWSSERVRQNTAVSDFGVAELLSQRTVVILTCPGAMRKVYAPYLGATLQKLMSDLDTFGEQRGGPLPVPIGVIIDEFPTLGRLDGLVESVNLVRKRRISILVAAQTKGQFHLVYGEEATKALFTGLATQVVYGGCDHDTAKFYSDASGTATADANPEPNKGNLRQRPLLTVDEIVNPQRGNCIIFSRFVEANFALQIILMAELTRLYQRDDWAERLGRLRHGRIHHFETDFQMAQPRITMIRHDLSLAPSSSSKDVDMSNGQLSRSTITITQEELDSIFNPEHYSTTMKSPEQTLSSHDSSEVAVQIGTIQELTSRVKSKK